MAVNVPAEEVAALNPELLRGITPPDAPTYTLNLPPNSKELFTKNITIARIEHPAVASHPIRTARSSERSYHSERSSASQHAEVAHKSSGKSRSYARSSKKVVSRTYAKQEKPSHSTPAKATVAKANSAPMHMAKANPAPTHMTKGGSAPVVQASMFGTASLSSRHNESKPSDAKKSKVALIGTSKTKTKGQVDKSKKSSETRLAKKSDNSAKSPSKSKKNSASSRSKDKYSQSHSKRPIMVSEAR